MMRLPILTQLVAGWGKPKCVVPLSSAITYHPHELFITHCVENTCVVQRTEKSAMAKACGAYSVRPRHGPQPPLGNSEVERRNSEGRASRGDAETRRKEFGIRKSEFGTCIGRRLLRLPTSDFVQPPGPRRGRARNPTDAIQNAKCKVKNAKRGRRPGSRCGGLGFCNLHFAFFILHCPKMRAKRGEISNRDATPVPRR